MKRITVLLVAVVTLVGVVALMGLSLSGISVLV